MAQKPKLLLHIGTEKTGTTSVQEFLAFNRNPLQQHGALYPKCLGDKNHVKITAYAELAPWPFASKNVGIQTDQQHAAFREQLAQQLGNELAQHSYHSAIISSEHLHSIITTKEQILSLKTFLEPFFSGIQVLVYFRRQDLMAVSLKSTALLVGHTPSRQLDLSAAKTYYYDFNAIYDNWVQVFGAERVAVRAFLHKKMRSGNVLSDFCDAAGLTEDYGLVMTERRNESLSLQASCLLHELNTRINEGRLVFTHPFRKRQDLIEKITAQYKGKPFYPSRQEGRRFFALCADSNLRLQEKIQQDLFDDDFSMYPEQENVALYEETRLWAKTALDSFDLSSDLSSKVAPAPTAITKANQNKPITDDKNLTIAVIANCQAKPLAKGLATINNIASVITVPIHLYGSEHFASFDKHFQQLRSNPEAIVLSYVNGDDFGDYATRVLKPQIPQFYTLTNLFFSGLHPDITYVGDQGGRIASCLGDYHSKIILHSFLNGLTVQECHARFCGQEYEKLGYFQEFAKSSQALRQRDEGLDIRFAEMFLELVTNIPSLYTINHPTASLLQEYTFYIAKFLGLKLWRQPAEMLVNHLANGVWWPIYPEIAETHHLHYRTPLVFRQSEQLGGKDMRLAAFINNSYRQYSNQQERLNNSRQVIELMSAFSR